MPGLFLDMVALVQDRRPHTAKAATVDEVAHMAAGVLASLGHRRAHFVGHSYGTFVISRICQLYPDVRSRILSGAPHAVSRQ